MYNVTMHSGFFKKLIFSALLFIPLAFLSWSLVGPMHTIGMQANDHGQQTSTCALDGMAGVCTMNPLEHLATWQSLFNVVPVEIATVLPLVLVLVFATFIWKLRLVNLSNSTLAQQKFYTHSHRHHSFVDFLVHALSQGILNPKLF